MSEATVEGWAGVEWLDQIVLPEPEQKRILVTGITGNLGRAAETYFGGAGWTVVGAARQWGIDLSNWGTVRQWLAQQAPFDLVLMAHGTQRKVTIPEYSPSAWAYIVGNNLQAAVILSRYLVEFGKLRPGALVVYCSSIQASQPRAGRGLYAIAKAGLEALARIMAVELAPEARAMTLRLGQMDGQMAGIVFPEAEKQKISGRTPLPWVGFEATARLVMALYNQPSLSGEVFEISSMHRFSIWPE